MASYRIQHITLEKLADQVRYMSGTSLPLTPAEMLQWLQKVKYIPQGWANSSNISLNVPSDTTAVCNHPLVRFGRAASALRLATDRITSTLN